VSSDSPADTNQYNPESDDCFFDLDVPITSPEVEVTKTLHVGDPLNVILETDEQGMRFPKLVTTDGRTIGGIGDVRYGIVMACMDRGKEYAATVKEINPTGTGLVRFYSK
jgi:hypothetical protein